jgi:hypothetical protein
MVVWLIHYNLYTLRMSILLAYIIGAQCSNTLGNIFLQIKFLLLKAHLTGIISFWYLTGLVVLQHIIPSTNQAHGLYASCFIVAFYLQKLYVLLLFLATSTSYSDLQ